MWGRGFTLAAEIPLPPPGVNDTLIVTVGGIVVAAVGALGLVLTEVVKGRRDRPEPRLRIEGERPIRERIAVLEDWRGEVNKADDIHDRTVYRVAGDVEDLVRWMDREHPGWRP